MELTQPYKGCFEGLGKIFDLETSRREEEGSLYNPQQKSRRNSNKTLYFCLSHLTIIDT